MESRNLHRQSAVSRDFSSSWKQLQFCRLKKLCEQTPNKRVQVQLGNKPRIYSSTCILGVMGKLCHEEYTYRPEVEQICIIRAFSLELVVFHMSDDNSSNLVIVIRVHSTTTEILKVQFGSSDFNRQDNKFANTI